MDYSLKTFISLVNRLQRNEYIFNSVFQYLKSGIDIPKQIILRHDVDEFPRNSLDTARMEHELGISGTYYFRMVPGSYDEAIIRKIAGMGHEIGYHYETMSQVGNRLSVIGNRFDSMEKEERLDMAYQMFAGNLDKLREIVPVETICMHGSPLSRFDNREIWKKYDYRELGIIGEASMDIDFSKIAYYTDTGRRWDGARMSVRDKITTRNSDGETKRHKGFLISDFGFRNSDFGGKNETNSMDKRFPVYHSTFEMIKAVENGTFPEQAMITIHPQRWNDALIPWTKELVWQNVKNVGKWFIIKLREHK